jgi:sec-independent protein translocase protein TatA
MANIGISELIVILLILMLVFGASRLPALGEGLGKAIRNVKRGLAQNEHIQVTPTDAPGDAKRMPTRAQSQNDNISDAEIVDEHKH